MPSAPCRPAHPRARGRGDILIPHRWPGAHGLWPGPSAERHGTGFPELLRWPWAAEVPREGVTVRLGPQDLVCFSVCVRVSSSTLRKCLGSDRPSWGQKERPSLWRAQVEGRTDVTGEGVAPSAADGASFSFQTPLFLTFEATLGRKRSLRFRSGAVSNARQHCPPPAAPLPRGRLHPDALQRSGGAGESLAPQSAQAHGRHCRAPWRRPDLHDRQAGRPHPPQLLRDLCFLWKLEAQALRR